MTSAAQALIDAVGGLADAAIAAGVDPGAARHEGLRFAAAIAESAPGAALDWVAAAATIAPAIGASAGATARDRSASESASESESDSDSAEPSGAAVAGPTRADLHRVNTAFFEAASAGRRWRAAPTALLSDLSATNAAGAAAYATALTEVASAACLLGEPTIRVTGNAAVAAGAQLSAAQVPTPAPRMPSRTEVTPAGPLGELTTRTSPNASVAGVRGGPMRRTQDRPSLGVGNPDDIPGLSELLLDNQRRVTEQLAAIERLRGGVDPRLLAPPTMPGLSTLTGSHASPSAHTPPDEHPSLGAPTEPGAPGAPRVAIN